MTSRWDDPDPADNWPALAKCQNTGDQMFPRLETSGEDLRIAKQTCVGCPVMDQCFDEALRHHTVAPRFELDGTQGVWAGLTTHERRAYLTGSPIEDCRRCGLRYANSYGTGACYACIPPSQRPDNHSRRRPVTVEHVGGTHVVRQSRGPSRQPVVADV